MLHPFFQVGTRVKNDERYWRHDWSDMSGKVKRFDKAGNGCNTREMPIFRWEWIVSISSFFATLLAQKCFTQLCDSSLECRPPSPIGVSARSKWVHFQGNWNAAFPKVVMASDVAHQMLRIRWSATQTHTLESKRCYTTAETDSFNTTLVSFSRV